MCRRRRAAWVLGRWKRLRCHGRLRPEPAARAVLSSAVIATAAAARIRRATRRPPSCCARMARGERIAALAHFEPEVALRQPVGRHARARAQARAIGSTATKRWCCTRVLADMLLVSARIGGERGDAEGVSLFLVPRECAGTAARRISRPSTASAPRTCYLQRRASCRRRNRLGAEGGALRADRSRARHRARGPVRRGGRHHAGAARCDRRLLADAAAIRAADRPLSGPAAPRRRHG